MSHPICERCQRAILPGQSVELIGRSVEELAEERIVLMDATLLVHADPAECKPAEEEEA